MPPKPRTMNCWQKSRLWRPTTKTYQATSPRSKANVWRTTTLQVIRQRWWSMSYVFLSQNNRYWFWQTNISFFRCLAALLQLNRAVCSSHFAGLPTTFSPSNNSHALVPLNLLLHVHVKNYFFPTDVLLSTAHKAKGLEFSTVRVTDDFTMQAPTSGASCKCQTETQ